MKVKLRTKKLVDCAVFTRDYYDKSSGYKFSIVDYISIIKACHAGGGKVRSPAFNRYYRNIAGFIRLVTEL